MMITEQTVHTATIQAAITRAYSAYVRFSSWVRPARRGQ